MILNVKIVIEAHDFTYGAKVVGQAGESN